VVLDRVGAVVEWLKGWDQAASTDLDEGGGDSSAGSSLGRSVLELCLGGQRRFFDNGVN
jgi:hypothetical protein